MIFIYVGDDSTDFKYTQFIIINEDIKGIQKGKLIGQGAHAAVGAFLEAQKRDPDAAKGWFDEFNGGQRKIILKAPEHVILKLSEKLILEYPEIPIYMVRDFGLTQIPQDTLTCMAIGPALKSDIDRFVKDLKLF